MELDETEFKNQTNEPSLPSARRRWLTAVLVLVAALLLGIVIYLTLFPMTPDSDISQELIVDQLQLRLQESFAVSEEYQPSTTTRARLEASVTEAIEVDYELTSQSVERLSESSGL